jgi:hypothetical protein
MSSMPRKPAQVWAIFRIRVQGPGEKKAYMIEDSHPGSLECGDKSPLSIIATCRAGLREAQPTGPGKAASCRRIPKLNQFLAHVGERTC